MATDWKHYFSIKLSGLFGTVGTRGKDRLYYAGGLQRRRALKTCHSEFHRITGAASL